MKIHGWKIKLKTVFNSNYFQSSSFPFKQYMAATTILRITPEDFEKCQPFGKIQLKKFVVINEKGSNLYNIVTYSSCRKFVYHA